MLTVQRQGGRQVPLPQPCDDRGHRCQPEGDRLPQQTTGWYHVTTSQCDLVTQDGREHLFSGADEDKAVVCVFTEIIVTMTEN